MGSVDEIENAREKPIRENRQRRRLSKEAWFIKAIR
jgi:hypothetical protein